MFDLSFSCEVAPDGSYLMTLVYMPDVAEKVASLIST